MVVSAAEAGPNMAYNQPSAVVEGLFLGSRYCASNRAFLRKMNITHVLSIGPLRPLFPQDFHYKVLPDVMDFEGEDLLRFFEECFEFIGTARQQGGAVLVHCVAGVSRSPTITIAFLMREQHLTTEQALLMVRKKHPILAPNAGFLKQLQVFEKMNYRVDANHEEYRRFLAKSKHTISFVDEIRHLMNHPEAQALSAGDPIEFVDGSVCSLFDESNAR